MLSSSWKVDSLPVFLFLRDFPHLSICSQISIFFATVELSLGGANQRRLAMSIRFSVGFFSTSSVISFLWGSVLTWVVG
jgi:hypothetical protein